MIELDWNRITVMVVDDNTFMRRLMASMLNAFGVKTVIQESECSSAIERLRLSRTDPIEAKLGEMDLILSDYVMPGIDGNLFLRWVRTGEGTPNRFVPFILVSGAASRFVVEEARNAGVSAVLAKPFSVNSMAERILWVVNSTNDFILARQYFGPNRRRMSVPVNVERRGAGHDDIQIVKPTSKVRTLRDDVRAIHFLPDNRLRSKLGVGSSQEIVEFDPLVLRAAEARIQDMLGDYVDWVAKYLDDMRASMAAIKVGPKPIPENRAPVGNIGRIAYQLFCQSETFGYPLITQFGESLYKATSHPDLVVSGNTLKLIEAHIDAISSVFRNHVDGDGGKVGEKLLANLARAVAKYT